MAADGRSPCLKLIERFDPTVELAFELRAELLTDRLVEQMSRLNVAEVAIGIQSISAEVNRNVSRRQDVGSVQRKLHKLMVAIDHTCNCFDIDLIFGLPGDTHDNYARSVDFVIESGLQVFYQPLRVFKGTSLRADAQTYGIQYNSASPYNVLCSPTYPVKDMIASYCLNVGLDFYNRGETFKEVLDDIAHSAGLNHSTLFQRIGRHFWDNGAIDLFRPSNWTPDDRSREQVHRDLVEALAALDLATSSARGSGHPGMVRSGQPRHRAGPGLRHRLQRLDLDR